MNKNAVVRIFLRGGLSRSPRCCDFVARRLTLVVAQISRISPLTVVVLLVFSTLPYFASLFHAFLHSPNSIISLPLFPMLSPPAAKHYSFPTKQNLSN